MSSPKFFFTDVFTTQRYGGNQLATFVDCESLSDTEMQNIAKEINFSETTFITSRIAHEGGFNVRIFTPTCEVDFAGHPTLGTAHIIRNKLQLTQADEVALNLRVGKIPVSFSQTLERTPILWMKQMPATFGKQIHADTLAQILGLAVSDIDSNFPIQEVSTGFPTLIVPLKNLDSLKRAKINKEAYFAYANDAWAKLILVFSPEGYEPTHKLSVRVFADYYGIAEDAATGSANGCLAAYLAGEFNSNSLDVLAGQGYEIGRPATLALRANAHGIYVGGSVLDVAQGEWG